MHLATREKQNGRLGPTGTDCNRLPSTLRVEVAVRHPSRCSTCNSHLSDLAPSQRASFISPSLVPRLSVLTFPNTSDQSLPLFLGARNSNYRPENRLDSSHNQSTCLGKKNLKKKKKPDLGPWYLDPWETVLARVTQAPSWGRGFACRRRLDLFDRAGTLNTVLSLTVPSISGTVSPHRTMSQQERPIMPPRFRRSKDPGLLLIL
jgi:hypothetical protein